MNRDETFYVQKQKKTVILEKKEKNGKKLSFWRLLWPLYQIF